MQVKKTGTNYEYILEGPIGEGATIFDRDVRDATKMDVDGGKMTYINSVGVKKWILWNSRIPATAAFRLRNLPLVMINQASTVQGFLPAHAVVESFFAPYMCPDCSKEETVLLKLGQDYDYGSAAAPKRITLPKKTCSKCNVEMEPDFLEAKAFTFLDRK